jgi:carboxypeptidase family protein
LVSRLQVSLVLMAIPAYAAESLLTGRVADENNTAIAEARVALTAGAVTVRATTDPTGAFHLRLPEGRYSVAAEGAGYFPLRERTIEFAAGPQELNLVLNHLREVFQSVKVEGSSQPLDIDQTGSRKSLTGLNVLNVPYPSTHDVRNAMKLIPGVVQDARGGLHFSGSAENEVLYTLDGFNVSDPVNGGFATRLDVDMVRSVEYSSGRYSPEFGKGSAGVLAIQTEMGNDTLRYTATNFVPGVDTRSGLHIGTFSPRFGLFGPIVKGRAWFSESIDGEYSTLVVPDLPRDQQRTTSLRLGNLLRTQINLTPGNILFASFLANAWTAPETGLGALDPPSTTVGQRTRTWFYSVKDQIYLAHGVLLELGFGEDRVFTRRIPQGHEFYQIVPFGHRGNFFTDQTQKSRRDQFLSNLFLPAFHLAGRHQLKVGGDLDRLYFDQLSARSGYDIYGLGGYLLHRTTFGGSGFLSRPSLEMSSYLVDAWRIRPNLTADLGVRQDWDELVRRTVFSPRLALAWAPVAARNTKISGGYAVTSDQSNISIFTEPLDQYAINTDFRPDGTILRGPLITLFTMGNQRLEAPRFRNWTVQLDQQLPARMQLSANYLRRRGDHGFTYANQIGPGVLPPPGFDGILALTNLRRDDYDSAQVSVRQPLGTQYEWMASYTRSRARSNSVLPISVEQTSTIGDNVGPVPWDAPNRAMGWFYLPSPWEKWAVAGLVEMRDGFPFSVQNEQGGILGAVNSHRFPMYFSMNLHLEYRFRFRGKRLALRGGFNNLTSHKNYTAVINTAGAPGFLTYYGSDGRHFVLRFRWLGKE